MIRIGLIGYGYWGPNLARNIMRCSSCELLRVVDLDPKGRASASLDWPSVETTESIEEVLSAEDIDAVVIATPIQTHYELALTALKNGKHVLVEKPMADSTVHAERLVAEAERQGVVLMVDHTFVYTEAVRWISHYVQSGQLGDLYYFDSIRANLGLFQRDASVLWDLAPHDLSILTEVIHRPVLSVSATGSRHAGSRVPDIAYLTLDLGDGCLAHFHVSWLSPVKVRRVLIAGSRKMIVFDDLETSEKVKIYDSGVAIEHAGEASQSRMQVEYRIGDMTSPALAAREALQEEIQHFVQCIQGSVTSRTSGLVGLEVVRVLEAAQQSLERGGEVVRL